MDTNFSRATVNPAKNNAPEVTDEQEAKVLLESKSVANQQHSTELTAKLRRSYADMKRKVRKKLKKDAQAKGGAPKSKYVEILGCARIKTNLLNLKELSPGTVLSTKRRTKLDKIRDEIPKPKRHVPPAHLPNWGALPLDMKLPLIDAGNTLKFSRGTLCQPLIRKFRKAVYTVYDPYNLERVIQEYSPLHDPHLKTFAKQPGVQKLLKKRGFIGEDKEVFCSVGQFNQYRLYLNHHQPDLRNRIIYIDNLDRNTRNQTKLLHKYSIKEDGMGARARRRVQENQAHLFSDRLHQLEVKAAEEEVRVVQMKCRAAERQDKLRARNEEMDRRRDENFERAIQARKHRRYMHFMRGVQKEFIFEARVKRREVLAREMARQKVLQHLSEQYEHQKARQIQALQIDEAIEEEMKIKAKEIQKKAEINRKAMPRLIARRKAREARIYYLMDKYFHLWLKTVRRRRKNKPDDDHLSLWDVDTLVGESLGYIRHMAGYETFDNIVLDVLKLKFMMKANMTDEEREEQQARAYASGDLDFLGSRDDLTSQSSISFKKSKSFVGDAKK